MIYLDYAATNGRIPQTVMQAVMRCMEQPGNPGRGTSPAALAAARQVLDARMTLAAFFGAEEPERVMFTGGATQALNTVLTGVIRPGAHVITTRYEHNSVLRPLYRLVRERGIALTVTDGTPEAMEAAMRPTTQAVVMTHASNVTGEVLDLRAAGRLCRRRGVLLIADGAQSAGRVPIDLRTDGVDILCVPGHKGLPGIQGAGAIILGETQTRIAPLTVGGSGIRSFDREHPAAYPEALEAGTLPVPAIAALAAGVREVQRRGIDRIAAHEAALARAFEARMHKAGLRILGGDSPRPRLGITALAAEGVQAARLADRLGHEYGICVRAGAHCAPLIHTHYGETATLRVSFGPESTMEEAMTCAEAIECILKEERG